MTTKGLSAIGGARLPLPRQKVFGFQVKHVTVSLSLLALPVHALLGVLHYLLCLFHHLRNKQTSYFSVSFNFMEHPNTCETVQEINAPSDHVNRTGLGVDERRSGYGFLRAEGLTVRAFVSL